MDPGSDNWRSASLRGRALNVLLPSYGECQEIYLPFMVTTHGFAGAGGHHCVHKNS